MPIAFGTSPWAATLKDELNASSEYANAAKGWGVGFNGNLLLAFEAEGSLKEPVFVLLRLSGGKCQGVEVVPGPTSPDAAFTLRGPYELWKKILERKMLAATAILMGKLKVEGDKMALLKHTAAHRALIAVCAAIDATYP